MMISSRLSAAAARNRKMKIAGFFLVLLLIGLAALWRAPLSGALWSVIAPLMRARFGGEPAVSAAQTATLADREALYQENLALKTLLGRKPQVERILGAVLIRPPATPYDTLVIDAGSAEGIALGDVVSAGGSATIGTISEVYTHAARVRLYSAPGEKYDALLRGTIPLAIEGQGGGSLRAQVPAGVEVSVGDEALLPGIVGGITARVSHIDRGEGESFVTLYFTLPVDLFTIRFVEVWKQLSHELQ